MEGLRFGGKELDQVISSLMSVAWIPEETEEFSRQPDS